MSDFRKNPNRSLPTINEINRSLHGAGMSIQKHITWEWRRMETWHLQHIDEPVPPHGSARPTAPKLPMSDATSPGAVMWKVMAVS